jgi:hypothetical protein
MSQLDSTRPEQENNFQSATSIEVFVQSEQRPRVIDKGPKSRLLESIRVSRKVTGEFLCQLFLQSDQIRKEFAIGESRMFKGLRQRRLHLKSSRCEHGIVDIFDNSEAINVPLGPPSAFSRLYMIRCFPASVWIHHQGDAQLVQHR